MRDYQSEGGRRGGGLADVWGGDKVGRGVAAARLLQEGTKSNGVLGL